MQLCRTDGFLPNMENDMLAFSDFFFLMKTYPGLWHSPLLTRNLRGGLTKTKVL